LEGGFERQKTPQKKDYQRSQPQIRINIVRIPQIDIRTIRLVPVTEVSPVGTFSYYSSVNQNSPWLDYSRH